MAGIPPALAGYPHLGLLHAIWTAETTPARQQRYRDLLAAALPPGYRAEPGHQAKWLWRTLRAAELAAPAPSSPSPQARGLPSSPPSPTPDMTTPPTRSDPNHPRPPRRHGPPA